MITFKQGAYNAKEIMCMMGRPRNQDDPMEFIRKTTKYGRFEYCQQAVNLWTGNTQIPWEIIKRSFDRFGNLVDGHMVVPLTYSTAASLNYDGTYGTLDVEWKDIPDDILVILHPAIDMSDAGIAAREEARKSKPTVMAMAATFADAILHWAAAGFATVTEEQYSARYKVCLECPEWVDEGWFKTGKCKVCGCSGAKLYMTTSECPLKKW